MADETQAVDKTQGAELTPETPSEVKPDVNVDDLKAQAKAELQEEQEKAAEEAALKAATEEAEKKAREDHDAAKELLAKYQTDNESLQQQIVELESQHKLLLEDLKARNDADVSSLPDSLKETVAELAGDDPVQVAKVIRTFRAKGLLEQKGATPVHKAMASTSQKTVSSPKTLAEAKEYARKLALMRK